MLTLPEICKLQFVDQLCLFVDQFKQFSVKFANQNLPSVRILSLEKRQFLFILQTQQLSYILLQKVLNCTLVSSIWIVFWPNSAPYPQLLELLAKSLRITSEKLIRTLIYFHVISNFKPIEILQQIWQAIFQ